MKIKNTETRILSVITAYPLGTCGVFVVHLDHPSVWGGDEALLECELGDGVSWDVMGWDTNCPVRAHRFRAGMKAEWSWLVGWCVTVTRFQEVSLCCFPSQACVISVIENPGLWLGLDSASNESQALLPM